MSELKTKFAKLRTVSKHERYRGVENATHALACRRYFKEEKYKNIDKKKEVLKSITKEPQPSLSM